MDATIHDQGRQAVSDECLKVATCQFPISADVNENAEYINRHILEAASAGADVVHFPEVALTGYASSCPEYDVEVFDLASLRGYDWETLRAKTKEILSAAREHMVWVVLGSTHYLSEDDKPTNCLYVISSSGHIVDRYDKCMCTPGDLKVYSPGDRLVTATVRGIKCGFLICADLANPSLYRAYRRKGVRVLLHSYYNARFKGPIPNDKYVIPENRAKAKEYGMWVFANNSSARHSCWPTHIAGPDGSFRKLRRHSTGILYRELSAEDFPDDSGIHTGTPSTHPRRLDGRALP